MATYTTLWKGNGYTDENKRLQQALKDAGYGSYLGNAGVDGIYGSGTESAVRAYQKANGLQEDGIAGDQTLGKLYSSSQPAQQTVSQPAPVAAEQEKSYRYDHANDPVYQAAQQKVTELEGQKPTIQGTYDEQMKQLYQQLMGQKEFSFDLNGDALWQQYKDQYTTQGKLAMMDTMGQAAALTGGYGSSYAQGVGQQAYQGYLQQVNDRVPELYQLALQKYNNDQAMLKDKLAITQGMADSEYAKDMDKMNLWYTDMGLAKDDVNTAYDRGQNAWYTEEQLRREDENTAYGKEQDQKNWLLTAMTSTGYNPSDAELAEAGMTREQANAFVNQYQKEMAAATRTSSGSYSAKDDEEEETAGINYKGIGVGGYNELIDQLTDIYEDKGESALYNQLTAYSNLGYMDEDTANMIGGVIVPDEEDNEGKVDVFGSVMNDLDMLRRKAWQQ